MSDIAKPTLIETLRLLRGTTGELSAQLRRASAAGNRVRQAARACVGGDCQAEVRSLGSARSSQAGAQLLPAAAVRAAFSGDMRGALQSVMSSLARTLTSQITRSMGPGLGAGLLGPLIGGGPSMLLGRLFRKRQPVTVDNTVKAEVLNFPRLSSLDFASNPASRLFAGRAVPRGPAFTVQVDYKGGAEEIVTAKVAARLSDINFLQGVK